MLRTFHELDHLVPLLESRGASVWQIEPGRAVVSGRQYSGSRLALVRGSCNCSLMVRIARPELAMVVMRGSGPGRLRLDGRDVPSCSVVLSAKGEAVGQQELELVIDKDTEVTVLMLAFGDEASSAGAGGARPAVSGVVSSVALRERLGDLVDGLLGVQGNEASESRERADREAEERVLAIVADSARESAATTTPVPVRGIARVGGLVSRFVQTRERTSIAEMCASTGLSRRMLTYAFQERYGSAPTSFFRTLALNDVRRQLIGSRGASRISEVAPFFGFCHMSRFAYAYERHFGELPSETIANVRWMTRPDRDPGSPAVRIGAKAVMAAALPAVVATLFPIERAGREPAGRAAVKSTGTQRATATPAVGRAREQ